MPLQGYGHGLGLGIRMAPALRVQCERYLSFYDHVCACIEAASLYSEYSKSIQMVIKCFVAGCEPLGLNRAFV